MAFNEDSSASGHDEPWIQWFCGLKGHEMFCEVERSYIEDGFNLYGLRACVGNFSDCLDLILDRIGPDDSDDSHLTQSACTLYGLIHARYIITAHGLDAMYNKYAAKEFGTCPLVQCSGQPVLPVGLKDGMGADTVKIYCPKCKQVYHTPPLRSRANISTGVDGAAFGTTFPHLFLMTFSNLVPDPLPVASSYVPRVFGFRVHLSAQRALPSEGLVERTAVPKVVSTAAAVTAVKTETATPNNTNRDFGEEDEEDKSPVAGEEAAAGGATTINNSQPTNTNQNNAALTTATRQAPRSKNKRRKDEKTPSPLGTTALTGAVTANNNSTAVAPTFLMENAAKRRRRGAGNT